MNVSEILEYDIAEQFEFKNDSERNAFLTELGDIFYTNLLERVLPLLNTEEYDSLDTLLGQEKTGHNDVMAFFAEHIETFPDILGDELIRTKEEAIAVLQADK
tara:strand:- start:156 stop:464 length:309 start_codon:yes stop_codon:yes gene_type:complete